MAQRAAFFDIARENCHGRTTHALRGNSSNEDKWEQEQAFEWRVRQEMLNDIAAKVEMYSDQLRVQRGRLELCVGITNPKQTIRNLETSFSKTIRR